MAPLIGNVMDLPPACVQDTLELDMAIIPMLVRMEECGVPVHMPSLLQLIEDWDVAIERKRYEIRRHVDWPEFNPDSPDQVAVLLFDRLHLRGIKATKTRRRYTTDDKTLSRLKAEHPNNPVIGMLQDYREISKIKSTFGDGVLERVSDDCRLHLKLNHTRVVSGRLSATLLLNMPVHGQYGSQIRQVFRAPDGRILYDADLSQIELRLLAHFSGDPVMCHAYHNDEDLHKKTACELGGYTMDTVPKEFRYACKTFNFGIAYGIEDDSLREQLATADPPIHWSLEKVKEFRAQWFKVYKLVRDAIARAHAYCRRHGYIVDLWGRPRYLPSIWSPNRRIRAEAERQAFNHVIQGGAAGVTKKAMVSMWHWLCNCGFQVYPLLQVHDELFFECDNTPWRRKELEKATINALQNAVVLRVPVKATGQWGYTWADCK